MKIGDIVKWKAAKEKLGKIITTATSWDGKDLYIVSVDGQEDNIIVDEDDIEKYKKSEEKIETLLDIKMINYFYECAFPENFYRYNGKDMSEKQINKWIDELKQQHEEYCYVSSGDTIVIKFGKEFIVAKNYYECN